MGTGDRDPSEHLREDAGTTAFFSDQGYTPPDAGEATDRTQPVEVSVPAPGLRGRHIAWARLEHVEAPPPPRPEPTVAWSTPAPPIIERPVFDPGTPSALGRLIAIIVTAGIGWALAVAIAVWILVFLLTRGGG